MAKSAKWPTSNDPIPADQQGPMRTSISLAPIDVIIDWANHKLTVSQFEPRLCLLDVLVVILPTQQEGDHRIHQKYRFGLAAA